MRQDNDLVVCQGLTKRFRPPDGLGPSGPEFAQGQIHRPSGPQREWKDHHDQADQRAADSTEGTVLVDGQAPGTYTHSIISYLPDRPYLSDWMRVSDLLAFFPTFFYKDFDQVKADEMLKDLKIGPGQRLKVLSKGTKEKVQLILTMSRKSPALCAG